MTEIPEHLLKRAAERRAAMGKGGDDAPAEPAAADAGGDKAAAAEPAAVEKKQAAPAPLPTLETESTPPPPDSPVVAAARSRKRVPFWAAPVLALLPLWGMIYVSSVSEPPAGENDPFVIGGEVYAANCASCHGANGAGAAEGGVGAQLSDGEILKTFPDPLGVAYWLQHGATGGARPDGTYGNLDREGGPQNIATLPGVMPAFTGLSDEEMTAVIIYMDEELSGGDPADNPNINSEAFLADAGAVEELVAEARALAEGDPDAVASLEGAETN